MSLVDKVEVARDEWRGGGHVCVHHGRHGGVFDHVLTFSRVAGHRMMQRRYKEVDDHKVKVVEAKNQWV